MTAAELTLVVVDAYSNRRRIEPILARALAETWQSAAEAQREAIGQRLRASGSNWWGAVAEETPLVTPKEKPEGER